ncbi:MAG TPA: hypothetical protein VGG02_08865 [Chthoniobacterales bacterium]|jgi:hypothetical protein
MPTYQSARSDASRLSVLDTTASVAPGDIADSKPSITQNTLTKVVAFIAIFRPLYNALSGALTGRMKEVREREAARLLLDTYVRDFWEVLKRRAHRLEQPAEVLGYYGLPSDGTIPVISNFDQLLGFADNIVKGDADAVNAGYPPMANPSAAEIVPILADARAQAADIPPADRNYDDAQAAVQAQRPAADLLIEDIHGDLVSSLRRDDAPSQRRVMRSYGLVFVPLRGELPDPEPGGSATGSATSGTTPPPSA